MHIFEICAFNCYHFLLSKHYSIKEGVLKKEVNCQCESWRAKPQLFCDGRISKGRQKSIRREKNV